MGAVLENDVNLRAPSHALRYILIAAGALALGGTVYLFESYSGKADAAKAEGFSKFRAAYAAKCGVPSYDGPVAEVVENQYVTSPPIKLAVDKELAALGAGATCEEVVQALKKVDLFIPAPNSEK
jgi:hypothetical protein